MGGLVIARWGTAPAFVVNGRRSSPWSAALLAMHTEGAPRPRRGRRLRSEIAEGVRYALRTPRIVLVIGLVMASACSSSTYNVLVPLLARDVLGQDAHGFGLLMTALGCGAVAGALVLASLGAERPPVHARRIRARAGAGGRDARWPASTASARRRAARRHGLLRHPGHDRRQHDACSSRCPTSCAAASWACTR